jgi:hypothetical protein
VTRRAAYNSKAEETWKYGMEHVPPQQPLIADETEAPAEVQQKPAHHANEKLHMQPNFSAIYALKHTLF